MEQKGFTLVEFMIAIFIFTLTMTGIYTVFIQSNNAFQSGRRQVLESQNARIAIEVMAREIRQATAFSADFDSLTVRDTAGNRISYFIEGPVDNMRLHRYVINSFSAFVSDDIKARYIKTLAFDYFGNDFTLDTNADQVVSSSEIAAYDSSGASLTAIDTQAELDKITLIKITVEVDTDRHDFNSDSVVDVDGSKNTVVETSVQLRNLKLF